MINILLSGCNGRMGRVITDIISEREDMRIAAGVDINTHPYADFPVFADISDVPVKVDTVIDFSNPAVLSDLLEYCVSNHVPAVLATTGYSDEQIEEINSASNSIALFRSANMSLGINLLSSLVKQAAKLLGDAYDIEIVEEHHNKKIDAPSGTAIILADAVAEQLPYTAEYIYDRHPVRKARDKKEIGIHSIRGGTIVGNHEVIFAGNDEVMRISHSASSRTVFANGAIKAAAFIAGKPSGLYSMDDIISEL